MIRGTTPTHKFRIPFNTDMVKDVRISYAQDGVIIAEKTVEDCVLEGNEITIKLTQEETLKFHDKRQVELQVRLLTKDGNAMATSIYTLSAGKVLNEEVLV